MKDAQANGVTAEELRQAKTKIASREVRAAERSARRMFTLAKDWAYLGTRRTVDDEPPRFGCRRFEVRTRIARPLPDRQDDGDCVWAA